MVGDTLRFVVVAGDLLEDDAAFPLDLLGREGRVQHDVADDLLADTPVFI